MPRQTKNMYGLTPQQEVFAQEVAKGSSQSDAYRIAYDVSGWKDNSIYSEASKMMDKPVIQQRINAICLQLEERMLKDAVKLKQHVLKRLVEESEDYDKGTATSRVAATVALGKTNVVRLFSEETEEGKKKDAAELERMLKDKLRDYFSQPNAGSLPSGTKDKE